MSKTNLYIVEEAQVSDVGKGIARISRRDMESEGFLPGDVVEIIGRNKTVAKIVPMDTYYQEDRFIKVDGITRENAGVGLEDFVEVKKANTKPAELLLISPFDSTLPLLEEDKAQQLAIILAKRPVIIGDRLQIPIFGLGKKYFLVEGTRPQGVVVVNPSTTIKIKSPEMGGKDLDKVSYEDIGGLDKELQKIREVVEYPLKYPELFDKLGIEVLKGVLLIGPSGVGKTLTARAIANEVKAKFFHLDGPAVMEKFYGESEAKLRQIFEEASANTPSIIFIDEIDAIAPKRIESFGNVEKRVVGQLLVLMDGLANRGNIIVIGATNVPDLLDPALRRPGRFDREIVLSPPDRLGRLEILKIHTRSMPLHKNVDLNKLAEMTHGFVGADLAALTKEAAMGALRRILSHIRKDGKDPSDVKQLSIEVENKDFMAAFKEMEPSILRELLPERPDTRLSDLGGIKEIRQRFIPIIELCLKTSSGNQEVDNLLPNGFLFVGESGTGKTLMAKAIAGEMEVPLLTVYGSTLSFRWEGESEDKVEEVFKKARQIAPCILLLDDVDAIIPARGDKGEFSGSRRVANQLLRKIDEAKDMGELVIIATTSRLDLVDPSLFRSGRFDYIVRFDKPDEEERMEIFKIHARGLGVREKDLERFAKMSDGLVGSSIESVCKRVRLKVLQRHISTSGKIDQDLLIEDFLEALHDVKEQISLSQKILDDVDVISLEREM